MLTAMRYFDELNAILLGSVQAEYLFYSNWYIMLIAWKLIK